MTVTIETLQGLCGEYKDTASPMLLRLNGEEWTAATNGMAVLATRTAMTQAAPFETIAEMMPVWIAAAADGTDVSFASLREFVGSPRQPTRCDECGGSGEGRCFHCDSEIECEHCEAGMVDPPTEPAMILGRAYDRVLLATYLAPVMASTVRIAIHGTATDDKDGLPLVILADDWCLVAMGLRTYGDDAPVFAVRP